MKYLENKFVFWVVVFQQKRILMETLDSCGDLIGNMKNEVFQRQSLFFVEREFGGGGGFSMKIVKNKIDRGARIGFFFGLLIGLIIFIPKVWIWIFFKCNDINILFNSNISSNCDCFQVLVCLRCDVFHSRNLNWQKTKRLNFDSWISHLIAFRYDGIQKLWIALKK